jgi:hypothetical protein
VTALVIGAVVAAACVVLVALPFLRNPTAVEDELEAPGERERGRLELAEERDRALAALKELEFDHRTGKIADEEYRAEVGPLRRRAADALRALDFVASAPSVYGGGMENPQEPSPPPGELNPPEPARIPEPYPPPDEGSPPQPAVIPEPGPTVIPEPGPQGSSGGTAD